ncbi:MAG TPA: lipid-A-disaccharide synthase-related protein [Candidatus Nitrosotenuis sp.]|jgi:uncharacterized protein (TIGR03492 family)|nr:lipid-A-disaccharide synthase-related protein [Candidatus Nitrosotenuis sp.]
MRETVLFVSNGAGEDAIAAQVAARLQGLKPLALPLVGQGAGYRGAAEVVGPRRDLPSGGLLPGAPGKLVRDLAAGLLGLTLRQLFFLRRLRRSCRVFVAVGDLYPVLLAGLAGCRPLLFVGTAKSVWHHGYSWPERWALRAFCRLCLVRDEPTARDLVSKGVAAEWVGNAMMDGLEPTGADLGVGPDEPCLALFPGSRSQAYQALPRMLEGYRHLVAGGTPARALVAVAPSLDLERLAASCPGWRLVPRPGVERGAVAALEGPAPPVMLVAGAFPDILHRSLVALGQAGTANEQAAGLGLPVVAFEPGGPGRLGWYRGRQKGLLGEALEVVPDDPRAVAAALARLLADPAERARRGQIGRARLGPAGGAGRMAALIEAWARASG